VVVVVEESHVERKSIHYFIDASPGEERIVDVFTVSPGKRFKLEKVSVFFPDETAFELEVAIFRALEQVKPTNGVYKGKGNTITDTTGVWFGTGEVVKLWYKNLNTTTARQGTALLEGFEV